ncbi:hypothetical protein B0H19DRAFT_1373080 [Mycena capillaripes]|nr:hypothetical protein B0H19DRAFT_1373080 [Mycena capillaripes]
MSLISLENLQTPTPALEALAFRVAAARNIEERLWSAEEGLKSAEERLRLTSPLAEKNNDIEVSLEDAENPALPEHSSFNLLRRQSEAPSPSPLSTPVRITPQMPSTPSSGGPWLAWIILNQPICPVQSLNNNFLALVISILELYEQLLFVAQDERNGSKRVERSLARLARVSKTTSGPALDILWAKLTDPRRLLGLIPDDALIKYQWVLRRPLVESDFVVFDKYALRVQSIHLSSFLVADMTIGYQLFAALKAFWDPILPHLLDFEWGRRPKTTPSAGSMTPGHFHQKLEPSEAASSTSLFRRGSDLGAEILAYLGGLPHLKVLDIIRQEPQSIIDAVVMLAVDGSPSFPSLEILHIPGEYAAVLNAFIPLITSCYLTTLSIELSEFITMATAKTKILVVDNRVA